MVLELAEVKMVYYSRGTSLLDIPELRKGWIALSRAVPPSHSLGFKLTPRPNRT